MESFGAISYSPLMNVMIKAVKKASRNLIRDFGELEKLQASEKDLSNFVLRSEERAEKALIDELSFGRPDFNFLTKNKGFFDSMKTERNLWYEKKNSELMDNGKDINFTSSSQNVSNEINSLNASDSNFIKMKMDDEKKRFIKKKSSARWIVNPLDGIRNFIRGIPYFSVSIALEERNEIIAGLTYNPALDQICFSEKGGGAFFNNFRTKVSSRKKISDSIITISSGERGSNFFEKVLKNSPNSQFELRDFGAPSLDLVYVATGKVDAFIGIDLPIWTIAAGTLFVKESSGISKSVEFNEKISLDSYSIISSNNFIFDDLEVIFKNAF